MARSGSFAENSRASSGCLQINCRPRRWYNWYAACQINDFGRICRRIFPENFTTKLAPTQCGA